MKRVNPAAARPSVEQRELIDNLGGPTEVGKIIQRRTGHQLTPQAISNWRVRGIPFRYRAPLALEAGERNIGVPIDFLGEQTPAPKPADAEVPFL
ncbi:MAG: hypothetical protein IIB77_13060 [Proteobacteria bacterium]|nr:hypothetical protein [Pseudomonadota bacterium]